MVGIERFTSRICNGIIRKAEPEDEEPPAHDQVTNIENEQKKATVHETSEESGKNQEETLESKQKKSS